MGNLGDRTGDREAGPDERRRVAEALRISEARFRALVTATSYAVYRMSPDWSEMLRLDGRGFLADTARPTRDWLSGYIHPDDRPRVLGAIGEAVASGSVFDLEHRVLQADGSLGWTRSRAVPIRGEDGRVVEWFGAASDVTAHWSTEAALRRSNEELEARVGERTAELRAESERRRVLVRRLSTVQEDERRRVSRDLHDSVGQLVAALALAFNAVEESGELPAAAADRLAEARSLVTALSKEMHELAVRLRPTSLDDLGLEPALGDLVAKWSSRTGVRADFQAGGLGAGRLPPEVETTLYRVVQEALTNVSRHAGAGLVSVVVTRPDGHATAVIEDDGAGFDPSADPAGRLGLLGMRERVELVGGELVVESSRGSGTTVRVRVPIPRGPSRTG